MKTTSVSKQVGDTNPTRKTHGSLIEKYLYRTEYSWYVIGVIVRILWTMVYPQRGYIHPVRRTIFMQKMFKEFVL